MTLLLQQEILEPAPPRRIIVPHGAEAHWGVDVSTRAVSIASVRRSRENGLQRVVTTVPWHGAEGGRRLAVAYDAIRAAILLEGTDLRAPGLIWVEQPGSSAINWPLAYMVGVVQSAVFAGALNVFGMAPEVETVPPSRWKKLAVGFGAIPKPTKKSLGRPPVALDYRVLTWARENGYEGMSWDEADAIGIAEAARRTVELVPR